ncbi:MlaD family protein [Algibacter mikhailovii]|uniref:Organic solvent ABC transporter substrate-binding protein n=1 Tax=Algibacter mikhailovii TaxID=425498 RepID=A0A918V3T2_9FLAO|nr:MlaD family protein [Algibacter mikhailovii]GGZ68180.1 organic solvent ABC transporter substrate-binding protein [Algibacter mikhailovii]
MKISREVKTGVLVILGIILFIFGFNYLKGENLLSSSRVFFTEYENVEGLVASTPVTISGMQVGKVLEIGFKEDGSGKLLVKILVESEFEFSKNSSAELYETGLIGGKAIAIVPAFDGAENAVDGDVLVGGKKAGLTDLVNQRLTPLQEKIETMMASADILLNNLNDVFDEETKGNLKKSIAELSETMASFKNTSASLNHMIKSNEAHIDSVLTNTNRITSNMANVTKTISDSNIDQTIKTLEETLNSFNKTLTAVNSGEGTMGKLLKDEALYENLNAAAVELEALLRDIKLHPKRYTRVLSKKEIPYEEETVEETK